jgi:hypothetical protein
MKQLRTPWGIAGQVASYHPERKILHACAADQGGFAVALDLPMPAHLAALGAQDESYRWFDEEHGWAAVATAFPAHFSPGSVTRAKDILRDHYPEAFTAHFGVVLTAATSLELEKREWEAATMNNFTVCASWEEGAWDIPPGQVYACGWRHADEATCGFLVPAAVFRVDPSRLVLDPFPRWEPNRSLPCAQPGASTLGAL